ncbi:hypothetical protein FHY73_30185 [Bacillus tropicus]|nr:hypothetical protein FHY73_30185 [Bacillus tropicus]
MLLYQRFCLFLGLPHAYQTKIFNSPQKNENFIILVKNTSSSRSVKGHSPVSRWELNCST